MGNSSNDLSKLQTDLSLEEYSQESIEILSPEKSANYWSTKYASGLTMTFPYIEQSTSVVNLLALNDSVDRGGDQQKKLQLIITNDNTVQPAGVTQKLFDSKVTFADLVRVCSSQEVSQQNSKVQLGNTLLSTTHASTLVSNYLNTYRSYLDQLRKTCGRGDSPGEAISSRTCMKSAPLVLPLARMTPVFSDDSREDPEFLELLKKTTTESIRKLWPHPNKSNIVRTAGLIDPSEEFVSMTVNTSDNSSVTKDKSEQLIDNSSLAPESDNSECIDYKNDTLDSSEDLQLTNCGQCILLDNTTVLTETETNIPVSNTAMKSNGENVLLNDGGSANVISKNTTSGPMQKGLLKVLNENLTTGDNFFRREAPSQVSSHSTNWSEPTPQQKCPNEQIKASSMDSFYKHQQKLAQQQQLQRQILQHQQQQHRQQQQQMIEQYHQQEQQRQLTGNKVYGFQPSESNKSWFPVAEESVANSARSRLPASNQQSATTYNPMSSTHVGLDVFSHGNQTTHDFFPSNTNVQSMSVMGSFMENQPSSNYAELSTNSRTLKASYACLDPNNPMTLSVVPLHDYQTERDNFGNVSDRQMSFGQSTEEKNCSNSSRSWADMSRAPYEGDALSSHSRAAYENDTLNANSPNATMEERVRRIYARTRMAQLSLQNDVSRQSTVQRPILKMNPAADNGTELGAYNGQSTRCGFEANIKSTLDTGFENGNRNNLDLGYDNGNQRYRWNSLTNCSNQVDGIDNSSSCTSLRVENEDTFMNIQPSTGTEPNSRVSRLYQWKSLPSTNDINYIPSSRALIDSSRMASNDSIANSLLSNIQTDRDFSWNASSMPSPVASMSSLDSHSIDQQVFGSSTMSGQYMFSDAYLNKVSSFNMDPRRQLTHPSSNASSVSLNQNDQAEESSLFYDADDNRQNTWSWKGRQEPSEDNSMVRNSPMCPPTLSQSMQILNNKILAAQSSHVSAQKSVDDNDVHKGKDSETIHGEVSPEGNTHHTENMNKLRLNRAYSDPNTNSVFRPVPHASSSLSHLSVIQQQRQKQDDCVYKISEELEKTYLDDPGGSTPWHEMHPDDNCRNHGENCSQEYDIENEKYVQLHNVDGSTMILRDQDLASLRSNSSSRMYSGQSKDHVDQTQGVPMSRNQEPPRPRMILGANSLKQAPTDEKAKAEVEESNRRIREMLGLYPNKEQATCSNQASPRMQDNPMPPQQPPSIVMNGQIQGIIQQGNAHSLSAGQLSRMQMTGNKLQAPMAMTQQMYCVPNILMPQQTVQSANGNRQSNLVPIQGMMTSVPSNSRFPQGMIRVPFVDMSRVVYVHQMPVNISSPHPNNNHNNSSSSNPHVNTSNIITINTNDNDFSANGQTDKSARPIRSSGVKNKATFIKMRSGSEEFTVPILGMRPSIDDAVCPRLIKTRTNPWDQDLDHDFSNSLMSKAVSMENISGLADPSICNSDVTMMYPDLSTLQSGALAADPATKTATFMQWPASADMHPEMLDMLPVRRAMPEDCGTGRLCWPEMEFLMSSREQLQSARRTNKPMGSNKANLISIIPKSNATEAVGALGKEQRFDKPDAKFL